MTDEVRVLRLLTPVLGAPYGHGLHENLMQLASAEVDADPYVEFATGLWPGLLHEEPPTPSDPQVPVEEQYPPAGGAQ